MSKIIKRPEKDSVKQKAWFSKYKQKVAGDFKKLGLEKTKERYGVTQQLIANAIRVVNKNSPSNNVKSKFDIVDKLTIRRYDKNNNNKELYDTFEALPQDKAIRFVCSGHFEAFRKRDNTCKAMRLRGLKYKTNVVKENDKYIIYLYRK